MADYVKNSLFVRNLSPHANEEVLREFFGQSDEIKSITFKPFSTLKNQFFAQIDFATSKGVAEGSRLTGSSILGVQCSVGVIDPLADGPTKQDAPETQEEADEQLKAETLRRACEADDDIRRRTIHVAGIGEEMNINFMRNMCTQFGPVEKVKIDKDKNGANFAMIEFREKGPAHQCKLQQQYAVNGRVLIMTEAQTVIDEAGLTEFGVEFEDSMINAMQMRSLLPNDEKLSAKIKAVQEAANALIPSLTKKDKEAKKPVVAGPKRPGDDDDWEEVVEKEEEAPIGPIGPKRSKWDAEVDHEAVETEKKKKKDKKEKKEKKEGKKNKKSKEPLASPTEKKKGKKKGKAGKKKPKAKAAGKKKKEQKKNGAKRKNEFEVSDETDGPVDLDEVEMVANTETVVMGGGSSSSSSSTSSSQLEVGEVEMNLVEDDTKVVLL